MEPEHLREDLKMEVALVVCEWSEEKVLQLHRDGALEFYVVRVILNQVMSNSSPFTKKYRRVHEELMEKHHTNIYPESHDFEDRQTKEALEDLAIDEISRLYWYDAELVKLYIQLGNYRALEEKTQIPFISCYKNIQKSIGILKQKAQEAKPLFTKEERSFIQNGK